MPNNQLKKEKSPYLKQHKDNPVNWLSWKKENLEIQKENQTIASVTYQNFFRTYKKLSGMTGTALTEATEFEGIYNLGVIEIPPNLKVNRIDKNDQIYMTKKEKYDAVIDLVKERHLKKQPILIGTTSVENSELISNSIGV